MMVAAPVKRSASPGATLAMSLLLDRVQRVTDTERPN
jgi:hypothetical protein